MDTRNQLGHTPNRSRRTANPGKPQLQPTTARRNCKRWLPWQLSGTHPYPCNYFNMRGIAETSGAWSDLLGEQPWPKEHSDVHPIHPPLDLRHCGHDRFMGLATLAPHENGKCIPMPRLVLPQKSLHPPHERFRPAVPCARSVVYRPVSRYTLRAHLRALVAAFQLVRVLALALVACPVLRHRTLYPNVFV